MLDGHVSLQQIKERFQQRSHRKKITFSSDLQQFHRHGCTAGGLSDQQNSPAKQIATGTRGRTKKEQRTPRQKLTNVFAFRSWFRPRENPQPVAHRSAAGLFTIPALLNFFVVSYLISAALLLDHAVTTPYYRRNAPRFHPILSPAESMDSILAATSGDRESSSTQFGTRGSSCKKIPAVECSEIGFIAARIPPLFCIANVSDSWMLPN